MRGQLGQSIWDKMKCYWELLEEHIENLRNMLRTKWELGGELIGKNQNLKPPYPPQKKQNWIFWVHAAIPNWSSKISIPNYVHHLG